MKNVFLKNILFLREREREREREIEREIDCRNGSWGGIEKEGTEDPKQTLC